MILKSLNIYHFKKKDKYILHPLVKIKDFVSIASKPYIIETNISLEKLLDKILATIDFSHETVFRPSDWKEFQQKHLSSMGIKSLSELHKDSTCLTVEKDDKDLIFVPTVNKGSRQGFAYFKEDKSISKPIMSERMELISALEESLDRCE